MTLKFLVEMAEGTGAAVLAIFGIVLVGLIYGPSSAIIDFFPKMWRAWKGKPPAKN